MKHMTLLDARLSFRLPGRKEKGITQQELEELSGVDRTRISKLESDPNANPTVETVSKLEVAMRLKPGTLVFGSKAQELAGV